MAIITRFSCILLIFLSAFLLNYQSFGLGNNYSATIKNKTPVDNQFVWVETDSSLTLKNHSETVWQFNFNNRFGKPYFHPLNINGTSLTCVSPTDHPWHLGLWFSWKFINGVNYWEYLEKYKSGETGYRSEGITEIEKKETIRNPDFSADLQLTINYHTAGYNPVLTEKRKLHLSAPAADGSYYIDEEHTFTALTDSALLDRTPTAKEPGGFTWGGYAGLSVRFNQDLRYKGMVTPVDTLIYNKGNWLYMGFSAPTKDKVGIAVFQHPDFTTNSTGWYVTKDPKIRFYYFSPAVLFDRKIVLKKGALLHLKYRIWLLPGTVEKKELQHKFDLFLTKKQ